MIGAKRLVTPQTNTYLRTIRPSGVPFPKSNTWRDGSCERYALIAKEGMLLGMTLINPSPITKWMNCCVVEVLIFIYSPLYWLEIFTSEFAIIWPLNWNIAGASASSSLSSFSSFPFTVCPENYGWNTPSYPHHLTQFHHIQLTINNSNKNRLQKINKWKIIPSHHIQLIIDTICLAFVYS